MGETKPLRVVVKVDSLTDNDKGQRFAAFSLVQRPVARTDEDENEIAITTVDTIPDGSMDLRVDTDAGRNLFAAGDRYLVTFTKVARE